MKCFFIWFLKKTLEFLFPYSQSTSQVFLEKQQKLHHTIQTLPKLYTRRVGVVGMGLIGGSIIKALRTFHPDLILAGYDQEEKTRQYALENRWIHQVLPIEQMDQCDLIVVATPIEVTSELLKKKPKNALAIDVASVMESIQGELEPSFREKVVLTHPMAGKIQSGFNASQETLFVEMPWFYETTSHSSDQREKVQNFIQALGAIPVETSIEKHDEIAALISHLPYELSKSYREFVHEIDPEVEKWGGPGLSAFLRLSKDNPQMFSEILKRNAKAVTSLKKRFIQSKQWIDL